MTEADAILREVLEAPDDDFPRLALADWLEENGRPGQAEFIRVQIRLAGMSEADLRCLKNGQPTAWHQFQSRCRCEVCCLRRREYETSKRYCVWDWCRGVPAGSVNTYRRGFVERVELPCEDFMRHAAALFAAQPITQVRLTDREPEETITHPKGFWKWSNYGPVDEHWTAGPRLLPACLYHPLIDAAPYGSPGGIVGGSAIDWHPGLGTVCSAFFACEEDAQAALSRACVAFGRRAAGLPALAGSLPLTTPYPAGRPRRTRRATHFRRRSFALVSGTPRAVSSLPR